METNSTKKILFPGSFEPFHNGHLKVLLSIIDDFDKISILVADNPSKPHILSKNDRKRLILKVLNANLNEDQLKKIKVSILKEGDITSNFARRQKFNLILRGVSEIKKEANGYHIPEYETNLLSKYHDEFPELSVQYVLFDMKISSSLIKRYLLINKPIDEYIDASIIDEVIKIWKQKN